VIQLFRYFVIPLYRFQLLRYFVIWLFVFSSLGSVVVKLCLQFVSRFFVISLFRYFLFVFSACRGSACSRSAGMVYVSQCHRKGQAKTDVTLNQVLPKELA